MKDIDKITQGIAKLEGEVTRLTIGTETFAFAPDFLRLVPVNDVYRILEYHYKERKSEEERRAYFNKLHKSGEPFNPFKDVNSYRQYMLKFAIEKAAKEGWAFNHSIPYVGKLFVELTAYFGGFHKELTGLEGLSSDGRLKKKGILLIGPKGTGKTFMLKCFMVNPLQGFICRSARSLQELAKDPDNMILDKIVHKWHTDHVKTEHFNQPKLALMIDDIGTEDDVNSYGNKQNIVADIIWHRAEANQFKESNTPHLFMTTNLSESDLVKRYGDRVVDRMREMLNFYVLNPNLPSLRK